jgi:uncharacterized protein (DUF885 family)
MSQIGAGSAFQELSQRLVQEFWNFYPTAGSRIGRHEYDGRLPDLSPVSLRRRVDQLGQGMAFLDAAGSGSGNSDDWLSLQLLKLFLKREHFSLTELRPLENNPMRQVGYLNVGGYLQRDYAPMTDRLQAATRVLQQVPEFLNTLAAALGDAIGRPVLEMSIEAYSGMARFYRRDLAQAVAASGHGDAPPEFNDAREAAASAIDRFVSGLETRLADAPADFAIGSKLYSTMLETGEGLDVPLAQVEALGQRDLERNLEQLAQAAESISPGRAVADVVADVSGSHPTAEGLLPDTREMLEDIRQSLIDLDLITIPSEDRCQVVETPTYMRYAFAAMDTAGALETHATESFYYVTPVEPEWTAVQQEEWLSTVYNYDNLRIISVHEVYPGHFVHYLHNRYGRDLPLVNRVATSYAFVEGWAHYCEQMMVETDYAAGNPRLRLTQLLEALVRNCRYMCSIWMHTQGMSVDDATRFFMKNAYMGEHPARHEAMRGTFDPGYLSYTLGKLMILKLREDFQKEQGAAYSLKGFHDELLSYGAPPVSLLRQMMLNEPGDSAI